MAKDSLLQVRVEEDDKNQADELFSRLGMDTSTAVRIFLKQSLIRGGLPFEVVEDPFYSESNINHLKKVIAEMEAGAGEIHALIEVDDE